MTVATFCAVAEGTQSRNQEACKAQAPVMTVTIIVNPRKLEHGFRKISARIPYKIFLKGMRRMMFKLSGFYYKIGHGQTEGLALNPKP